MSDRDIRELERRARAGDKDALWQLGAAQLRAGNSEAAMAATLQGLGDRFCKPIDPAARLNEVDRAQARREPQTDLEHWTLEALELLTAADGDRATELNRAGWNRVDGQIGRDLLEQARTRGLSSGQWAYAARLCRKYWRQVGQPPASGANAPPAQESA